MSYHQLVTDHLAAARLYRLEDVTGWEPGDPCATCGSTETGVDDFGVPFCGYCHRSGGKP